MFFGYLYLFFVYSRNDSTLLWPLSIEYQYGHSHFIFHNISQ
ncbi:hypothetical protein FORC065_1361 [Yersinia enterocolitica]|nr:hypothetical protein FORC065_1361 [Yersinia enterocolitica]